MDLNSESNAMSHVHSKCFDFILLDIKFCVFIIEFLNRMKSTILTFNNSYYQMVIID